MGARNLVPANPVGDLTTKVFSIDFDSVAAGSDATTEGLVVPRTGFVTAARVVPKSAVTANASDFRTWVLVDPTTRAVTDGCIVDPANAKGAYNVATAYTAGQFVAFTDNNLYVCISNVTGGTGPGVDTSHWQPIVQAGLNIVNSVTAKFTADDVDKRITDSGNTDIPATSFIGSFLTGVGCTAVALIDGTGASVNGVAVVGRTVTIGASRNIGTFDTSGATSLAADTEQDLTLSATDRKVFKGDVLKLTSTHTGSTGVADGGGALQVEITTYADQGAT